MVDEFDYHANMQPDRMYITSPFSDGSGLRFLKKVVDVDGQDAFVKIHDETLLRHDALTKRFQLVAIFHEDSREIHRLTIQ